MRKRVLLSVPVVVAMLVLAFVGLASAGPSPAAPRDAVLSGAAVVSENGGDPDGGGQARLALYPGKNKICYNLSVSNIEPATAAHLHRAPAGEVGPVVLNLKGPRDQVRECRRGLGERFIRNIGRNTSSYYVDIHNGAYGQDGALRGQLARAVAGS